MQSQREFNLFLKRVVVCIAVLPLLTVVSNGGQLSESQFLFSFIKAVDPQNVLRIEWNGLLPHPCMHELKGVKCNLQATAIEEIRLENLNLSGILDAGALCRLPNLQVLSLAKNHIRGIIPYSILYCTRLTYLNLSNNLLSGRLPMAALTELKYLRTLDVSNNRFTSRMPYLKQELKNLYTYSLKSSALQKVSSGDKVEARELMDTPSESPKSSSENSNKHYGQWVNGGILVLVIAFLLFCTYLVRKRINSAKEREILKGLQDSPPPKTPSPRLKRKLRQSKGGQSLCSLLRSRKGSNWRTSLKPQLTCKTRPFAAPFTR